MGKFTVIPQNTFDALQLDAGVLLKNFDPDTGAAPKDEDIICATTGGINPVCQAEFSDLGEDIDNVPNNMKELMHLDGWTCTLSTTSLGTSAELIAMALGCADIDGGKIVPRADLKQSDFGDIWWVGDKANGGFVAIRLKNALSTEGFSLQTTKNGKGQIDITITGHVSINAQSEVPMTFYSIDGEDSSGVDLNKYTVTVATASNGTLAANKTEASAGDTISITVTPDTGYELDTLTYTPIGGDATDIATSKSFAMPSSNVAVNGTFKVKVLRVTFDSNGGSEVDAQDINYGGTATEPTEPTKDSDTFDGWYTDDTTFLNRYDFSTEVTDDITLYAKWS